MSKLEHLAALRGYALFAHRPGYVLRPSTADPRVQRWTKEGYRTSPKGPSQPSLFSDEYQATFDYPPPPAGLHPTQKDYILQGRDNDPSFFDHWVIGLGDSGDEVREQEVRHALTESIQEALPHLRVALRHHHPEFSGDRLIPGSAITADGKRKGPNPTWDNEYPPDNWRFPSRYVEARFAMESSLGMRHPGDNTKNPVYGVAVLVGPPGEPESIVGPRDNTESYGDYLTILHKDVLARTGFTFGDSLNLYAREVRPRRFYSGMIGAMLAAGTDNFSVPHLENDAGYRLEHEYPEAQVMGGVSLARDVEHLGLPLDHLEETPFSEFVNFNYFKKRVDQKLGVKP